MPAHERADARLQFADAERFGQVVVRTALEADDRVGLAVTRREHQDRSIDVRAALPRRAAERDAVEAREHDIEQQQIEPLLPDAIERLAAVSDAFGLEPCQAQMQPQDLAYRRIVLDDERLQAWRRSTHQRIFLASSELHGVASGGLNSVLRCRRGGGVSARERSRLVTRDQLQVV